jgi:hypothetical protein
MFCIAYVLQFVHKRILQRFKASEVSLCSVSKVDSYPRRSAVRKKPDLNTFLLSPRSVPVSRGFPRAGDAQLCLTRRLGPARNARSRK